MAVNDSNDEAAEIAYFAALAFGVLSLCSLVILTAEALVILEEMTSTLVVTAAVTCILLAAAVGCYLLGRAVEGNDDQ